MAQGVVNRDIKLENTLLDQSRRPLIKICDFGYSKHLQKDSVPKSRVGTPGYTGAPLYGISQGALQSFHWAPETITEQSLRTVS